AKDVELEELVKILKESIQKIDNSFVCKLKGENGFENAVVHNKEMRESIFGGGVKVLFFSSWIRFALYEVDFGWGRPVKVCP
ncbi:hypothetical protein J0671_25655, partial [Vibrio sp. Vb0592]|uniref:acyltransferase n=1 Tax=Vibrio sp. Vb0592 TaxID=2816072 RepID=UPI001A8EFEAD